MNTKKKTKRYLAHHLNLRPYVDKIPLRERKKYIPEGYDAVVTISADFELAWAWQHAKGESINSALKHAQNARKNIPVILDLSDKYNIPITWFTVGHLFLDKCEKVENAKHPEIIRLPHFENKYWEYKSGDWFDFDPASDYQNSPEWYAPDIIEDIISRKVNHEIGCHTFSHIDCRDHICSDEVFESEIKACISVANKYNIDLKSFVHPAHTIGHLDRLNKYGFTSYRDNSRQVIGYPELYKSNLWKLKSTAILNYTDESEKFQVNRLKKIVDRTINYKANANIWFHPSVSIETFSIIMNALFDYLNRSRQKVYLTTVGDYVNFLNQVNEK